MNIIKLPLAFRTPSISSLKCLGMGKVRETFEVPGRPDLLLVVATDRLSAHDFVLNTRVPKKGEVLTLMSVFFTRMLLQDIKTDLFATGEEIRNFFPSLHRDMLLRSVIVKKADMLPIEVIVRGNLTGSGLKSYNKTGKVCGIELPKGLKDGSPLPQAIFTPTTKATIGHDEHRDAEEVVREFGPEVPQIAINVFSRARQYADERGIIIADTKFEFGLSDGMLVIGDEKLTPDSSRFWPKSDLEIAMRENRTPKSFDKQPVRDYLERLGVTELNTENPEHIARVHGIELPKDLISWTSQSYITAAEMLTGMPLADAQREYLKIAA